MDDINHILIHTHLWYTSHHKYNLPRSIYIQTQNTDDGSITWPLHTHTRIPNTQESLTVLQPRWSINDRSLGHSLWNAVNSLGCNATILFNCHSLHPVLYHSEQIQHISTYLQCIAGMLTTKTVSTVYRHHHNVRLNRHFWGEPTSGDEFPVALLDQFLHLFRMRTFWHTCISMGKCHQVNSRTGSVLELKLRFLVKIMPKLTSRFWWGSKSILRQH